MKTLIMKFGGTSIGTPERVKKVCDAIIQSRQEKERLGVVISAFSGVTDQLIKMCTTASDGQETYRTMYQNLVTKHENFILVLPDKKQNVAREMINKRLENLQNVLQGVFLLKEMTPKTLDYVMSFGEWFSGVIISELLKSRGENTAFVDARKLVRTNSEFGAARVDFSVTNRQIQTFFSEAIADIHIITGFCGATEKGETTTLGRSGSDYTAAIFGAALDAEEIQIWTDVDGVMTADPRKVPDAFSQNRLTYEEAMEMSHFGAKVIHPPTMQPAMGKNIPIRILNTFNPGFPGTVIHNADNLTHAKMLEPETAHLIKGVTSISGVALLRLEGSGMVGMAGTSMRTFGALARKGINIILITQASSEHSICFAVAPTDAETAKSLLEAEFELEIQAERINPPILEQNLSIIAIVGENMRHTPGISGRLFDALGRNGVNVSAIAQGSSELNISVVISSPDETKALNAIHEAFFLSETRTLHVFLAGVGLVGGTLLKQIRAHADFLRRKRSLNIRVVAIANSRVSLFKTSGIELNDWQSQLGDSAEKMTLTDVVVKMFDMNLRNSVFVDCTASDEPVKLYIDVLKHNISIVTPNKKGLSGDFSLYRKLQTAAGRGAKFLYETNVGAGLPVISTLRDLISSGDEILKIEAILSGTLSYIFNTFDGKQPFSAVVKTAMEKGYTEPDPRDDLNGVDVARKLLILARETGLPLEMRDISLENLVPEDCQKTKIPDDFFANLAKADVYFEAKRKQAALNHQRLRYIATLENGQASVKLAAIGQDHPFYNLAGSDNIISITTDRYRERPLVIKGSGAGAAVTAAGVFADIVRILS